MDQQEYLYLMKFLIHLLQLHASFVILNKKRAKNQWTNKHNITIIFKLYLSIYPSILNL